MEEPGQESTSTKASDQEKYARNLSKLETTKQKFEQLTMEVNTKLIKLESKIERVSSDVTIKFSKEI